MADGTHGLDDIVNGICTIGARLAEKDKSVETLEVATKQNCLQVLEIKQGDGKLFMKTFLPKQSHEE